MATLFIPDKQKTLEDAAQIADYLRARGVRFEQWTAHEPLDEAAGEETVLAAYKRQLEPFMAEGGYRTADVICVNPDTPGLPEMREKFLREHTHSEDEIRFFVAGRGYFWFNFGEDECAGEQNEPGPEGSGEPVVCVKCEAGDLLSVPAGYKHWFDLGEPASVKAIRIFVDPAGWVPEYTGSGIDAGYRNAVIG